MVPTHRYLALIPPSASIGEKVMRMRATLHERVGGFTGRKLMPHITLFLADVPEAMGASIVVGMEASLRHAVPFTIHYQVITHFPDRRTIYVDPVEKEAIAHLRAPLVAAVRSDPALGEHVRVTDHPHLTIAAGLKPAQFEVAWTLLEPHVFQARHTVMEVCLLRRALIPNAVYEMVSRFLFR